jgi:hypothetical protein
MIFDVTAITPHQGLIIRDPSQGAADFHWPRIPLAMTVAALDRWLSCRSNGLHEFTAALHRDAFLFRAADE